MESALLGLVLDSSAVMTAERKKQTVPGVCRREYIEELLILVPVHPVTTAWLIGQIEGQEAAKGNLVPFNDLLIAATAIEQGYAVLTGNIRHFRRIPGLGVVQI
jgi:predicted nucleic acid-binding protein